MRSFIKFLGVGGTTAALYFGLLGVSLELLHWNYGIGVSAAYAIAITFHFLANRHYTFRAGGESMRGQVMRFLAVAAVNYGLTMLIVHASVEWLGTGVYLGTVVSIGATVLFGYAASRIWVFQKKGTVPGS